MALLDAGRRECFEGGYIARRRGRDSVELTITDGRAEAFISERPTEEVGRHYIVRQRDVGLRLTPDQWDRIVAHVRDGDPQVQELKRSLDDALSQVQRLSDDRDHWEQEAENWKRAADSPFRQGLDCSPANVEAMGNAIRTLEKERDEAKGQSELWKSLAERQDNTAPLRMELRAANRERDDMRRQRDRAVADLGRAQATEDADVDELKATVVRQAREITRLKGESG